ncbi:hypothetical protein B296_00014222 [Ensete ventricosum]|uniref:Uncharacterized protein n=1 Tax=Ensete ventricosum TaxID=4639 RepID=A0A427A752_ENSVE|nr:hypothetical protein B296_00014222 [Ensete ventricosum]
MAILEQVGPIGLFNTAPQTVAHKFAITDSLCDRMVNHVAVQIRTAAIVWKTTCEDYNSSCVWRWRRLGHGRRSPEQLEARADAGGEDGDPGEDGRAEQDQADGYHPQLLVGLVEGESPPRQQPAAADADEQKAAVGGQSHSEPGGHSARAGVAALEGFRLLHRLVCRHRFGLTRGGGRHGTEQFTPGDLCGWRGGGSEGWRVERQRQATLPTMVFGGVINTMVFAWEYYMDVYILIC